MRLRGITFLVPFFPLTWLACFSPSSGGGGNAEFDASFDAEFDSTSPDAEPAEGSVEAAADVRVDVAAPIVDASVEAEAGSQPITVLVTGALGYEQGVNVVFGDATGAVVTTAMTGPQGTASTLLPGVTMATVLLGTQTAPAPYTVMGLVPGSLVPVVDLASAAKLPSQRAEVTAIPTSPSLPGVVQYYASTGSCWSYEQSAPFVLPFASSSGLPCVGLAQMGTSIVPVLPMVVEAVDVSDNMLGFTYSTNTSPAMPDDAGYTELAFNGTWTAVSASTSTDQLLDVTNVPDGGGSPQVAYSEVADGILNPLQGRSLPADAGASTLLHVQTHTLFASAVQAEALWVSYPTPGGTTGTSLVTSALPPSQPGTLSIDASGLATAPNFQTGTTASGPTAAQPVAQWTLASGDLGGATGLVTNLGWSAPLDGGGLQNGSWTIVSKGTTGTSITVPALPASLAGYAPLAGAITSLNEIFAVYGQTSMTSYSSMIPLGSLFQVQPCSIGGPAVPPLTGLGTALVVGFAPGSGC